jgi:hypothetical protein
MKTYINDCILSLSRDIPSVKEGIERAVDSYFSEHVLTKTLFEKIIYFFRSFFAKREATNILWNYKLYNDAIVHQNYQKVSNGCISPHSDPRTLPIIRRAKKISTISISTANDIRLAADLWKSCAPRFSFFL